MRPDLPQALEAIPITVVALGGSAAAPEPLRAFLAAMPPHSGAAFVFIQHPGPNGEEVSAESLTPFTAMEIVPVRAEVPVRPGRLYVVPPGRGLEIHGGTLRFADPMEQAMVIDPFFRSLAEAQGARAIGILLGGTGPDGTQGARAVRSAGGMVMAQDSALSSAPPQDAIGAGLVDHLLAPERMPEALMEYLRHPYAQAAGTKDPEVQGTPADLLAMLALVRTHTGVDFRAYKQGTITRRVARRMGLRGIRDEAQYRALLGQDPQEVKRLFRDLLINVTAFFRDPEAFQELQDRVILPLVQTKGPDDAIRVWVPGCSTGEEAYGIAILVLEQLAAQHKTCSVQVFATDIDEAALETARRGRFPASIAKDVEPPRLAQFFRAVENGFKVSETLRKAVTFACHNLLTDPPFSRMDLISCRNLLIYLEPDFQTRLLSQFNFTLLPTGCLFLGKSETASSQTDLFEVLSKSERLYRRRSPARPFTLDPGHAPYIRKPLPVPRPREAGPGAPDFGEVMRQAILGHFGACVVLVDRKGQFLQFHGQTGRYLKMPASNPSFKLLDLAREGLASKLRLGLRQAIQDGGTVVLDRVRITEGEAAFPARVTITPIPQGRDTEPLLAVFFETLPEAAAGAPAAAGPPESDSVIRQLEEALDATQLDLQATIQELETANEELRVANEEVSASNEELQSSNEELETSAEEVQSSNEELTAVNSQLQIKIEQLDQAYSDMANLLNASEIATVFLDPELRVKFFTPAMTRVLNLIPSDLGRPVTNLSIRLAGDDLVTGAQAVLRDFNVVERKVQHTDGTWYLMRVMPYRTRLDQVDGVVVTLSDVTLLRREEALALLEREAQLARSEASLCEAQRIAKVGSWTWDPRSDTMVWTEEMFHIFGREPAVAEMRLADASEISSSDVDARTSPRFEAALTYGIPYQYARELVLPDGTRKWLLLCGEATRDENGAVIGLKGTVQDITERRQAEEETLRSHQMLAKLSTHVPGVIFQLRRDREGQLSMPFASQGLMDIFEVSPEQVRENAAPLFAAIHPEDAPGFSASLAECARNLGRFIEEYRVVLPRQGLRWRLTDAQPERQEDGSTLWHGYTMDITASKRAETEKQELAAQLNQSQKLESLGRLAGGVAHDMNNVLAAILTLAELQKLAPEGSEPLARAMDTIIGACTRGRDLVKSLLHVARKDLASLEPLDLNALVRDMVQLLEHTMLKKVSIIADLQEPLALIQGDGGALSHAIMNLFVNALDAMPHGGSITIRTRQVPTGAIELSVIDTGEGMSPEVVKQAMEPFFTTKPLGKGTGLGLTMVYSTLKAHGAVIEIKSDLGRGTEVLLRFPPLPGAREVAKPDSPAPAQPSASNLRILLVDDDEHIRAAIPLMLRRLGHFVETVAGGQEALDRFAAGLEVDLVILDMNMPGLSGTETLERLLAVRPHQAVLMASGYNDEAIEHQVRTHPRVFALQKPFTLRELQDKLREIQAAG